MVGGLFLSGCGKVAQETSASLDNDQNIETASVKSSVQIPDTIKKELLSENVKAIICVTPEKGSIQEAINKATAGTVIYISAGTYNESEITIQNKDNISLIGAGINLTKIVSDRTKGIYVINAKKIKIANLFIPAIIIENADDFTLKTAKSIDASGAVTAMESKNVLVMNCIFEKASGGVALIRCEDFIVKNNIFISTKTPLYIFDSSDSSEGEVKYNLFYDCSGGVTLYYANSVVIQHNTFDDFISAIYCFGESDSDSVTIKDNIFSNLIDAISIGNCEPREISHNCFYPNTEQTMGENYITADPKFVNRDNGDYHLQEGSPCIGTASDGTNRGAF
jgi:hypothetical protein